ncbi:MAG: dienelactone hydrolase family protein [Alphaproteobacteria bacterium]|nr:dienelactone hydrolase family protein [Alphaproteobacteria bacterium]MCB9929077.1 dienelactone hydrolase family protein [Alphaproteobacteria bacterium]
MKLWEDHVTITTKYGRMPAFAAAPAEGDAVPAIIFYMDAPGFREELCNMARRIAKAGYFCLLPDMYYRLGTVRFDLPRRDDGMSAVIRAAMNHLTNALVVEDTGAMLAWLDAQGMVKPGPVGCVGHCMSGRYITTVAARFPHRMAAAASLYGVGIVTDQEDSPHRLLDRVEGELYYCFAEIDATVPENVIPTLTAALEQAGTRHLLEQLPGTQHGFQFSERPAYAPEASEHAWNQIFRLWERNLR